MQAQIFTNYHSVISEKISAISEKISLEFYIHSEKFLLWF